MGADLGVLTELDQAPWSAEEAELVTEGLRSAHVLARARLDSDVVTLQIATGGVSAVNS